MTEDGKGFFCEDCPMWHIPSKDGSQCVLQVCDKIKHNEIIGPKDMCHVCTECQVGSAPNDD